MSPEANVQEKLTVTAAPPPAAVAADKRKAAARKRTEAENLIDGHAAGIATDKSVAEKEATLTSQGRRAGIYGFIFFGVIAFWTLTKYGRFLHADLVVEQGQSALVSAYHNLISKEWFFGLSSRLWAFRIFATIAPLFLALGTFVPKQFGRAWMGFGGVLGMIMTPIMLTLMYYVGIAPWAVVMRIFGYDPLRRSKTDGTYWIPREKQRKHDHFEHMS